MNLIRSAGAAAIGLAAVHMLGAAILFGAVGLGAGGGARAQTSPQAAQTLTRAQIRSAVGELADLLQAHYVFPDVARQYAEHLRTGLRAGGYDRLVNPAELANTLETELNAVHRDAHLRVDLHTDAPDPVSQPERTVQRESFGDEQWLAEGVAYMRINLFTSDEASVARMTAIMERYAGARAFIFDLRNCRGGALETMDPIFAHLFSAPRELVVMDAREGGEQVLPDAANTASSTLRSEPAPDGISRQVHWAVPVHPVSPLANARVYVLTDFTASACEHFSLALQHSQRATLVGATTRGAGHFGGQQVFGDGRFEMFMPVGRTYPRDTGVDWEGTGIAPDRATPAAEALNVVLADLNIARSAATDALTQLHATTVSSAPANRRYGIMMEPPQGGESFVAVVDVAPGEIAARAGLRGGDRIISVNGAPVAQIAPAQFNTLMRAEHLVLVVERQGQQLSFDMSLGR